VKIRHLIVNADDFGYSYGINKGIIEAHTKGIVTSTSVMVDAIAAKEAAGLAEYPDLSVGLHFELNEIENLQAELERQIEKFISIVGRQPDHLDTHKRRTTDEGIKEVLEGYLKRQQMPVRNFNAKHIGSFGINSNDVSVAQLEKSIDEATEEYNELMCHVGYSDDYLRKHSSYNDLREQELKALTNPAIKAYLNEKGLQLINWSRFSANR
jgi:predicted glycoside hydrolase/deacetylase ChbG (UPF0249 family)